MNLVNLRATRLLCFILVAALYGCSKNDTTVLPAGNENTPSYGDMYVASSIGDASYLNPILATDSASGGINGLVYNGLVKYDKNLKLTGDLAESWSVSENGLVFTFKLRHGIKWHDGEPFTAEDVKFTFEKLTDPEIKTPYGSDFLLVSKFTVIDDYTIQIIYSEPFAPALESWGMGIVPKHIFSKGDFNTNPANRAPVGTGPYIFKEWKTDQKIVLEANPAYFENKPFINRYIYRVIPDQSVQFLELRKEGLDEMSLTPDQWKAYPEFFKDYNKFRYPSFSYVYMGFNLLNPLFKEKKLRKAIAYGINKKDIIDGVLLGMGKPATGPYPPQSWAYNTSVANYEYNPEKSIELLKEIGWQDTDNDGYLDRDGKRLEFTLITNQGNKLRSLSSEIIQSQLKKVGIKVNLRIIEWSAFIHQFIDKRNFDAVMLGWSLSRDPDQYSMWHSGQTKEGQYNFVSYKNEELDSLLENGRRIFDQKEREKIYNRVHEIIADDLPYIFLYYPESLIAVHKRFRGPEVAPAGLGWNFHKWWVPKNEQKYSIN